MPAAGTNGSKRKTTVLPLHIDTTSFTNPPQQSRYPWRRVLNKRQLPFLIILTLFVTSIAFNLVQYGRHHRTLMKAASITSFSNDPVPQPHLVDSNHAVIVAGHAIFVGSPSRDDLASDDNWVLEPFQKNGQVSTFVKHIEKGLEIAAEDPKSVLIFSGGQTRLTAGPRSEGLSYWLIADELKRRNDTLRLTGNERMVVEEYARDSYENLLFSICRFYEITGRYPSSITVIGFDFKKRRFQEIHLPSLRYPIDRFQYIGIDPPFDPISASEWLAGEAANSQGPFQSDLYGCHGTLRQKKVDRNPFRRRHAYRITCPALAELIDYCPSDNSIFSGPLPWDR